METNFYRKIKQGAKIKGKNTEDNAKSGGAATSGLAALNILGNNPGNGFNYSLPPGAKVLAIAGSADEYIRSIYAYFKV